MQVQIDELNDNNVDAIHLTLQSTVYEIKQHIKKWYQNNKNDDLIDCKMELFLGNQKLDSNTLLGNLHINHQNSIIVKLIRPIQQNNEKNNESENENENE